MERKLRTYMIDSRQSEPHNKNQNFAELGWRDTKTLSNRVLERSGAPKKCWFLALRHVCMLMNHVAHDSLDWRTAAEWLLGYIPDITVFLIFMFYEPVYYMELEPSVVDTTERLGRFVGISHSVGHSMTFMVLTEEDKIIHRASVHSAVHGGEFTNIKVN